MAVDPTAIGAVTEPRIYEWTDRDTLLHALGGKLLHGSREIRRAAPLPPAGALSVVAEVADTPATTGR